MSVGKGMMGTSHVYDLKKGSGRPADKGPSLTIFENFIFPITFL